MALVWLDIIQISIGFQLQIPEGKSKHFQPSCMGGKSSYFSSQRLICSPEVQHLWQLSSLKQPLTHRALNLTSQGQDFKGRLYNLKGDNGKQGQRKQEQTTRNRNFTTRVTDNTCSILVSLECTKLTNIPQQNNFQVPTRFLTDSGTVFFFNLMEIFVMYTNCLCAKLAS